MIPPVYKAIYRVGALLGVLLVLQGLFRFGLVDPGWVADLLGFPRSSPLAFLVFPFLTLGARFVWILLAPFRLARKARLGEPGPGEARMILLGVRMALPARDFFALAESFVLFGVDFTTWVLAMFAASVAAGGMVTAGVIPNQDPPLFEVLLNLFLGSYLLLLEPRARLGAFVRASLRTMEGAASTARRP